MQDLDIDIVHRSGRLHSDADVLSRNPVGPPEEPSEIPLLSLHILEKFDVQSAQEESNWWKPIILALEERQPSRHTRKLARNYELKEGILYHRLVTQGRMFCRLCVPPTSSKSSWHAMTT